MPKQNESLDVSANSVEEAIEQGLAQLGLSQDRVDIEIIKEGKRGVFGIGAEKAQVRLTPRLGRKQVEERSGPARDSTPAKAVPVKKEETPVVVAPTKTKESVVAPRSKKEEEVGEMAAGYLADLLTNMGIKANVTVRVATDLAEEGDEPPLVLDVTGNDLGILIGRRSETLQALQFMVRLMVNKTLNSWESIVVDVESYRVRRRRSLRQMAEKMAERAVTSRKKVVLEAMPPHERRIVHIALKDHPAVITKSVGNDDNRKVTIVPK